VIESQQTVRGVLLAMAQKPTDQDWEDLRTIFCALSTAQLNWLRTTAYAEPWLEEDARPALALEPLVTAARDRPFPAQLQFALHDFSDALSAFASFYVQNAFPDPLMVGDDWRVLNRDPESNAAAGRPGDWNATEMRQLSLRVGDAYEGLIEAVTEVIAHDRKIRKRYSGSFVRNPA
jgi:hypothetical protein